MDHPRGVVATGQQIGAGWSPALSVVKALAALAAARRRGLDAVYWLADEDHDRLEVAQVTALRQGRLHRHRFRFEAPAGTAAGWLPWGRLQQEEAEALWGPCPAPEAPTLRGHALALGAPLWARGLRPFSPTEPGLRGAAQETLLRWRSLDLEGALQRQAERLESEARRQGRAASLQLDPRRQGAWFSLDPASGLRRRLEPGEPCPPGRWLSPGAALRPLLQSLLLPVRAVVLGPAERTYWRLTEPLWERVGQEPPEILPRPSVFVLPAGALEPFLALSSTTLPERLEALRLGRWERLAPREPLSPEAPFLPSQGLQAAPPSPAWGPALAHRYEAELARARARLEALDRRHVRDQAARALGRDPEVLRQTLFPLGRPMERVLPGLPWLRDAGLLDRLERALGERKEADSATAAPILLEEA